MPRWVGLLGSWALLVLALGVFGYAVAAEAITFTDARTLKRFEERSGIHRGVNGRERHIRTPTLDEFFERQAWLPQDNPVLLALRNLLMGPTR